MVCGASSRARCARYPVPEILWHGMISAGWHVTVQNRLPGRPLLAPGVALDGPMLDAVLRLVELQADAGIPAGERDFTGYVANVLFDGWDEVWADAPRACAAAGPLCARLRRWLEPGRGTARGQQPTTPTNHLTLFLNVLTDGARITGVVDWDEFGLGSRALDLVALAVDCEERGDSAAAPHLLARAAQLAGADGLRCLVSYRIIGGLAVFTHERQAYGNSLGDEECAAGSTILDRLQATGSGA